MVDIQPQSTQPISDDQELAKVLAGISQTADDSNLQFEAPAIDQPMDSPAPAVPAPPADTMQAAVAASPLPTPNPPAPTAPAGDLGDIKKNAINSLKPLLGKLQSSPEDTFDAYLLIIRSTDDSSLINEAYAAAQNISDETRKAQALLEIVKEIDYLSNPK
jgi:hypothetical protein